ncbi:hypothetical protein [Pseudofrankia sp. EUN1h]|uniref:hypothetical protein n=1 Tax=Pseudofrankia sp. EUN1h TaxID=1834515 RepID=UPI001041C804|nr:hypothetical protein [Pseudofrankia sp. EUN1h]
MPPGRAEDGTDGAAEDEEEGLACDGRAADGGAAVDDVLPVPGGPVPPDRVCDAEEGAEGTEPPARVSEVGPRPGTGGAEDGRCWPEAAAAREAWGWGGEPAGRAGAGAAGGRDAPAAAAGRLPAASAGAFRAPPAPDAPGSADSTGVPAPPGVPGVPGFAGAPAARLWPGC